MARVIAAERSPVGQASTAEPEEVEHPEVAGALPGTGVAGLYEAWAERIRGYIGFRVRDPDDAEDLVAEVFRRAVSGPRPSDPGAYPAWMFRVAHNLVVDHYRRRRTPLLPDAFDRADDAPSLPERLIRDEELRAADQAIGRLVGRQRAAIYLRFYADLPYEAVGSVMGVPASTARTLVRRGLARLAAELGEEFPR